MGTDDQVEQLAVATGHSHRFTQRGPKGDKTVINNFQKHCILGSLNCMQSTKPVVFNQLSVGCWWSMKALQVIADQAFNNVVSLW